MKGEGIPTYPPAPSHAHLALWWTSCDLTKDEAHWLHRRAIELLAVREQATARAEAAAREATRRAPFRIVRGAGGAR